ncbi:LAFA_0E01156g1_1 [Lachancea sp. 'fantastica']|nr:LAFA_0E01156g1_1 [Lachancea sp. 'fantastica']
MNTEPLELVDDVLEDLQHNLKDGDVEVYEFLDLESQSDCDEGLKQVDKEEDVVTDEVEYQHSKQVFGTHIKQDEKTSYRGHDGNKSVGVRLARIRRELEEFKVQEANLADGKQCDSEVLILRNVADQLDQKLQLQTEALKKRLQKANYTEAADGNYASLPNLSIDFENGQRVMHLEARMDRLEQFIGMGNERGGKSLTTMLNEVYRDIGLLKQNPSHLTAFKTKLSSISDEYEQKLVARKASGDPALQKHILETLEPPDLKTKGIYDSYAVLRKYKDALPHLVSRMKTLNSLHIEIGDAVGTVKTIDKSLNWVSDQTSKWQQMLEHMDAKLNAFESAEAKNMQEITKRLNQAEKRIDDLK